MSTLDEMWQELARYQPYTDRHGFGEAWKRMTTERTQDAAFAASAWAAAAEAAAATWGPAFAAAAAEAAAWAAAWAAAEFATNAEEAAAEVAEWKGRAIENIRDAIAQEEPL